MDINERFALWGKKYKPHGEHEELLYIIAKDAVAALSSPHPEAREEDIDLKWLGKRYLKWMANLITDEEKAFIKSLGDRVDSEDEIQIAAYYAGYLLALSRLAAQKDEGPSHGQTVVVYPNGIDPDDPYSDWHGHVLPRPSCGNCAHIYDECEGRVNGSPCASHKPAATEPRPAEEPVATKDSLQIEPAHAQDEELTTGQEIVVGYFGRKIEGEVMVDLAAEIDSYICSDTNVDIKSDIMSTYSDLGDSCYEAAHAMPRYDAIQFISKLIGGVICTTLRSQLARKDEGLREALEKIARADRAPHSYMTAYAEVVEEARAALREPDGRKGE